MASTIKVCVTGASGFLAANLIPLLLDEGYEVHAVSSAPAPRQAPEHDRLTWFTGRVHDASLLERAMQGCTCVIHAAGLTRQDLPFFAPYREANVTGTANVAAAAIRCGVQKLVYVSSANTIGYGIINTGQETVPATRPFMQSFYARSKMLGEAEAMAAGKHIAVVVVNPSFMLGRYDHKQVSGNIVARGLRPFVLCPPGGKNFVHVRDVAKGIVAAMERGTAGERYLLAGENLTYEAFFERMNRITQQNSIIVRVPRWLLLLAGTFGSILRLTGLCTPVSLNNMRILCTKNYYSGAKARQQLGVTFLPVEYGIADALSWLNSQHEEPATGTSSASRPGSR